MWGMPGKQQPHREHNPLSLLGACHTTPIRKLNDPGPVVRPTSCCFSLPQITFRVDVVEFVEP